MILINKKSKLVVTHRKYARFSPFIRVAEKYFFFPTSTIELANLRIGSYVHFVDMGKATGFIVNNDDAGLILCVNNNRDATLKVCSRAIVDWFRDKHNLKAGESHSFYVVKLDTQFQGHQVYEILTETQRRKAQGKKKAEK